MYKGNAVVIVLPLLLMGFIFFGGYHYLNTSNQMTNEDLDNVISFAIDATSNGSTHTIIGDWDWQKMPVDGVLGDDYIGVKLVEEGQEPFDFELIKGSHLVLKHGGNEIYETEGTIVNDGIVFTFPNEMQEHMGYGNMGSFEVVIVGEEFIGQEISISYLHTWDVHDDVSFDRARLSNVDIDINHWVIERFTAIPQP
ncbi:hypothetical protein [Alkalihalobacillus sp. BA299]|uniref:hypothetical protein n=1 Tax=Alkalihalobacillus sp. BA299 TaxID=2815938 RepID=UPI001AD99495|nr:hypothetical protein [Alkalihalobacillus sp. BA299]